MNIDWHVKDHNPAGIRFYERCGAHRVTDRISLGVPLS